MNSISINRQNIYPSKIICVGRNYASHIKELNNKTPSEPVIFLKPNSSITRNIYFNENDSIDYEGEISFAVHNGVLSSVGIGLDLTKRSIQADLKDRGLPWERAKSFDKSAVFSDFVMFNGDVSKLKLELYKNNKLVQLAESIMMINNPNTLLKEINTFLTLEDGDVIMTGTPEGVGNIQKGDSFSGKLFESNTLLVEESWVVK